MTRQRRRVAITGLGFVTPLGNDTAAAWQALLAGRSGVAPITRAELPRKWTPLPALGFLRGQFI